MSEWDVVRNAEVSASCAAGASADTPESPVDQVRHEDVDVADVHAGSDTGGATCADGDAGAGADGNAGAGAGDDTRSDADADAPDVTPEELAENNALALAFDDVRAQSAASELVTPNRWVDLGLVPDHMTPEDFEMLVYDYLQDNADAKASADEPSDMPEDAREGHPADISGDAPAEAVASASAGAPAEAVATASHAASAQLEGLSDNAHHAPSAARLRSAGSASSGAAGAHLSSPYASRSVGVPRLFAAPGAEPVHMPETKRSIEPPRAKPAGDGLNIPEGFELVELEGEWVLVEKDEAPTAPAKLEVDAAGIQVLVGARSYYLYSSAHMTDAYAHWAFLAAEDNPLVTFADCVREDSRVYPRPMARESFANPPFRMSAQDVEAAWEQARELPDYADIRRIEASNGDVYFYSTTYLSAPRAEALAEWDAVERYMNV